MTTLDIGCGNHKLTGSIGIDVCSSCNADIVHDANKPFTMFENESIDRIVMNNSLEHLNDVVAVMTELHRMLRKGGTLHIEVPHVASLQAFADPTHRSYFTMQTMNHFTEWSDTNYYSPARFRIISRKLRFLDGYQWLECLLNIRPDFTEKLLRIIPLHASIVWDLEKI